MPYSQISDCNTGSVKVYDGIDFSASLHGIFCGSNIPSVFTSSSKNLYIVYTNTDAFSAGFKAAWKKVTRKLATHLIHIILKIFQFFSHLLFHSVCIINELRTCH